MDTIKIIHQYKQGERKFPNLNLKYEYLDNIDLSGSNLCDADFSRSALSNCNLSKIAAKKVKMWRTHIIDTNLSKANLYRGNMVQVNIIDSDLSSADLSYSHLLNGYLNNVNLSDVNLNGTDLTGCEFVNCDLPSQWFNTKDGEIKLAEKVVGQLACEVDLDAAGFGQSDITLDFICASICPYALYPVRMTSFRMPSLAKYLSPKCENQVDEVIKAVIRIAVGEESVFIK